MKKILFLLALAVFSVFMVAQDKTESKDEFVLKLVRDIMSACEEGQDTTLKNNVVMTSDSLKSYVINVAKGDSVIVDSLSAEEREKVVEFVKVVASKTDSTAKKTIVTTVKRSNKKITFDLDFDALGDSIVFDIDLDSIPSASQESKSELNEE